MRKLLILLLLFTSSHLFSQECDCYTSFQWVQKTFEENDAGFSVHLAQKGEDQYKVHSKMIAAKSNGIQDPAACENLLAQWLYFFRKEHLGIALTNKTAKATDLQAMVKKAQTPQTTKQNQETLKHERYMSAQTPFLTKLSDRTRLLRIPHMWYQFKTTIDSLVSNNLQTLTSTENLIIDIRNNGGGSDYTYESLIPLAFTNPIRTIGAEFRATPLNNEMLRSVVNEPSLDQEIRSWAKQMLDKAKKNNGSFVPMDTTTVSIRKYDTIYASPQNIAILIDHHVASASEQFLLEMKQSRKVKLYGITTAGALDMANVNDVVSPCKDFLLSYALSRRMRIPDMSVDEKGIAPDYYLDPSIPSHQWISYVRSLLENR